MCWFQVVQRSFIQQFNSYSIDEVLIKIIKGIEKLSSSFQFIFMNESY